MRKRFSNTRVGLDFKSTWVNLMCIPMKARGLEDVTFRLKQSGCGQVNIFYNN